MAWLSRPSVRADTCCCCCVCYSVLDVMCVLCCVSPPFLEGMD